MFHRKTVTAWLTLTTVVVVLYTCIPPLFFNDGDGRIAGMPEMLFWFTVLPFVIPAFIGALYVYDARLIRRHNQRTAPESSHSAREGEVS